MDKPITLTMEEFKRDIVTLINTSNLPAFIVDMIIKDISAEISLKAKEIADNEKQEYLLSLNEKEEE